MKTAIVQCAVMKKHILGAFNARFVACTDLYVDVQ